MQQMRETGRIIRAARTANFTIVPNELLRDKSLSLQAKALLSLLLSFSDEWKIYKDEITGFSTNGKDATNAAFKELETACYIKKTKAVQTTGRFAGYDWTVYDTPQRETRDGQAAAEKPQRENRSGKPATNNTILEIPNNTVNKEEVIVVKNEEANNSVREGEEKSLAIWVNENAPKVQKLKEPMTQQQYDKLLATYGGAMLHDVLLAMQNRKPLLREYESAYLTANNWCSKRKTSPNSPDNSKSGSSIAPLKNVPVLEGANAKYANWFKSDTHPLRKIADKFNAVDLSRTNELAGAVDVLTTDELLKQELKISNYLRTLKKNQPEQFAPFDNEYFALFADKNVQPLGERQRKQYINNQQTFRKETIKRGLIQ